MIAIAINGEVAWPVFGESDAALEAQIDDLLGHLTDFWKPLMLRQVYPIDVSPRKPSDLYRVAADRWAEMDAATIEWEEEAVVDFEEAHNLARAFAGLFDLPPFWMLRSGDYMIVEAANRLWRLPFEDVRASLSAAGELVCDRLATAKGRRWKAAIEAWHRRDEADSASLLAWSAGLDHTLAFKLIADGMLAAPRDFDDAANDDDELRIAARVAGALPPDQIRAVIELARQFERCEADDLRELAKTSSAHIAEKFERDRPHVQGEAAARFVRKQLELPIGRVDVFSVVADLGVSVRSRRVEPSTLDALAIWGKRHGPGAFLNEASPRLRPYAAKMEDNAAARVTLAHELCHLLLDGGHALSAVEVLKARMPTGVEQRAKSFAGEFLLPSHDAITTWFNADLPDSPAKVDEVIVELTERFGVTRSVAAWKLEHGAARHGIDLSAVLDMVVPGR